MLFTAFFTDKGTPKTGLTPLISIVKADGTVSVNAQAMTEISLGFYKYDWAGYDEDQDYVISADGTATLTGNDRYAYATNETGGVGNILKISKNKWQIINNQLILYDDDGSTALYTFSLVDSGGNASMQNIFKRTPV